MKMFTTILLSFVGLIALLLIIALFLKKQHYVKREIVINVPQEKAFNFLRFVGNQDKFNKWARTDPDRKVETTGNDGEVGYIYSWSGNKDAGQGAKEIKNIIDGKRIETEIRFIKPMQVTARMIMETESLSENQTKVNFINTGTLNYPLNLMIPFAEKNFAKDLDSSLATLKQLLESTDASPLH